MEGTEEESGFRRESVGVLGVPGVPVVPVPSLPVSDTFVRGDSAFISSFSSFFLISFCRQLGSLVGVSSPFNEPGIEIFPGEEVARLLLKE